MDRARVRSAVGMLAVVLLPLPAFAGTYAVPADFATIQEAITGAEDGSTILVSPGTYRGMIVASGLNKDLYLRAAGGAGSVVLDGGGTERLLRVVNGARGNPAKNLVFDGFTFRNGWSDTSSPVAVANARPTFLNCVFSDNVSTAWGGAVVVNGGDAAPSFVNCVFSRNRCTSTAAGKGGGAVLVTGAHAQATFKQCRFEDNSANAGPLNHGGAIYFSTGGGVVQDCVFAGNAAGYAGGAIMALAWFDATPDLVQIRGSRFEGNSCAPHSAARPAPSEGGAVMAEGNVTVTATGCSFSGNAAEAGGAVHSYRAHLTVSDCAFDGNVATGTDGLGYGGAIGVNLDDAGDADRREAVVVIERTMIRNSTAPIGGAIRHQGDISHGKNGLLTLRDVTIDSCRATTGNGGVGQGGALFLSRSTLTASRTYLLRNVAEGTGGAAVLQGGSTFSISSGSFVAGNEAGWGEAAIYNPGGLPVSLGDTVLAYNGGAGTATATLLAATPAVTVAGTAHLAYFVAPYAPGLAIDPLVGAVAAGPGGAHAAGAATPTGVLESTTFSLAATPPANAAVAYTSNGLTDTWFGVEPHAVPGVVEAEQYDRGGEGLAYADRSAANEGGDPYRPGDGVDLVADAGASNGRVVGMLEPGEWLDFTVSSPADGLFDLWAGLAPGAGGGELYVQVDGEDVTGVFPVPPAPGRALVQGTGVLLTRGQHLVRVVVVHGGFALDYLEWTVAGTKSLLSLGAEPGVVTPGGTVALEGSLFGWPQGGAPAPLAGVFLTLEHRTDAETAWTELALVETAPDGSFAAAHAPAGTATYRARWEGALIDAEDYPPAQSSVRVPIAPEVTAEVRGYRGIRYGYHVFRLGGRVLVLGSVTPAQYPGAVRVQVERRARTGWRAVAARSRALDAESGYRWRWRPPRAGRYRISTAFAGDADAAPSQSGFVYVKVR